MKIVLDPRSVQDAEFMAALIVAMRDAGGLVAPAPRTRPYSVLEAAEETGLSAPQVRRLVSAGRLRRIEGLGRMLITVDSMRNFQAGRMPSKSGLKR